MDLSDWFCRPSSSFINGLPSAQRNRDNTCYQSRGFKRPKSNFLLFFTSNMASAYQCAKPLGDVFQFWLRDNNYKLYKAPPNKLMKPSARPTSLVYQLPVEILHSILLNLDLRSIGMLHRVDTLGRQLVESLPAYALLKTHASHTICIIDATKCSSYFPINWLFAEFCHPWCEHVQILGPSFTYLTHALML